MKRLLVLCIIAATLAGCREDVLSGLNERQANSLIAGLDDLQIEARKAIQRDGSWSVSVAAQDAVKAYRLIDETRLLQPAEPVPDRSNRLVTSREEERFYQERQIGRDLERTILSFPGIRSARVHLALPQSGGAFGVSPKPTSGSGSILIVVDENTPDRQEQLQALVGGATGLPYNQVSVVRIVEPRTEDLRANRVGEGATLPSGASRWLPSWAIGGLVAITFILFVALLLGFSRWRTV